MPDKWYGRVDSLQLLGALLCLYPMAGTTLVECVYFSESIASERM